MRAGALALFLMLLGSGAWLLPQASGATLLTLYDPGPSDIADTWLRLSWSRSNDLLFQRYQVFVDNRSVANLTSIGQTTYLLQGLTPVRNYSAYILDVDSLGTQRSNTISVSTLPSPAISVASGFQETAYFQGDTGRLQLRVTDTGVQAVRVQVVRLRFDWMSIGAFFEETTTAYASLLQQGEWENYSVDFTIPGTVAVGNHTWSLSVLYNSTWAWGPRTESWSQNGPSPLFIEDLNRPTADQARAEALAALTALDATPLSDPQALQLAEAAREAFASGEALYAARNYLGAIQQYDQAAGLVDQALAAEEAAGGGFGLGLVPSLLLGAAIAGVGIGLFATFLRRRAVPAPPTASPPQAVAAHVSRLPAAADLLAAPLPSRGILYLVEETRPTSAVKLFLRVVREEGRGGLAIVRSTGLRRELEGLGGAPVEFWWLSQSHEARALDPTQIGALGGVFARFYERTPSGVLLLEGLEYLITQNTFEAVLRMLQHLADLVHLKAGIVLATIDPRVLASQQLALLERVATPVAG